MISGFLARGLSEDKAAAAGVYLHGLAADFFAEQNGESGLIAADLPEIIPYLMNSIISGVEPLEKTNPISDLKQSAC